MASGPLDSASLTSTISLDLGVRLAPADRLAGPRQVEEDDLAELVLRVPGDAERGGVAVDAGPVVLLVVLEVRRIAGLGQVSALLGDQWLCAYLGAAGPAAHVDLERCTRFAALRRQVRHADAVPEHRRQRAGGDDAAAHDRVALARDESGTPF